MVYLQRRTIGIYISEKPSGVLWPCPNADWDTIFTVDDPADYLLNHADRSVTGDGGAAEKAHARLVSGQEVWAAGVTYYRSRTARMAESDDAGGGDFYDRVYDAPRPELFFKGNARTVVACGEPVQIRSDSTWNVPEPEVVLVVNAAGKIIGYTAGNDVSSRSIEGENPLYLPQAKTYNGSCSLGPVIALTGPTIDRSMGISLEILREGQAIFNGNADLTELKRDPGELVSFLFHSQVFPVGCFLMTGTGIVPDDSFTLKSGDKVTITVGDLPPLVNTVG